jgi:AraC-like DNA-binding protein
MEPRALRSLLRQPLNALRDNTVAFADLGFRALLDVEDAIANLRTPDRLGGILDRFFLRRFGGKIEDDAVVDRLTERLRDTRGAQPILEWAREQGLDTRTLERRFVARMGMTPKQFARIERFKHGYRLLTSQRAASARRRAHLDGYYDESHFHREFRHFTGASPLARLREAASFTTVIADHLLEGEYSRTGLNPIMR